MSGAIEPTKCAPVRILSTIPPMLGVENFNGSVPLVRSYSPVTLSHEWSKLGRLLLMLFCICFGSTMNGFFVASFIVERSLRKLEPNSKSVLSDAPFIGEFNILSSFRELLRILKNAAAPGNVFLACVGLADLIVTTGVIPVVAVVILSGEWDNINVCRVLQFLSLTATYCYVIYFAFVAVESYYRICRPSEEYAVFISMRIDVVCILIFGVSVALGAVGVYLGLDYDYCEREHYGDFIFRISTMVIFQVIPLVLTIICLFTASTRIRRRARKQIKYKRSYLYERDSSITAMNITAYLIFVISWAPYIIIVHEYPSTSDSIYYNLIAIGLFRSAITSSLYGIFNRNFRRAYAHLFNYCCCKSSLSGSFSNRHRRTLEYKSTIGDVRVHIMHHAVSSSISQRTASCMRETHDL